jgi:prepilin-type N-terminal cleavage/methylation domain-containing protein
MKPSQRQRPGLTLIELVVVVGIIAVLMSLVLATVQHTWTLGKDLEDYSELMAMHIAVANLNQNGLRGYGTGPGFLPSEFDPSGGDPASAEFIVRLFGPDTQGKLNLPAAKLQGQQALVLLLGGPNGTDGWSLDLHDPVGGGGQRVRPFPFKKDRLVYSAANGYPSYLDNYGTPVAYFSAYHWQNGPGWALTGYRNDCPGLGVSPYVNDDRYGWQLISAGGNKRFGRQGAVWTAATASKVYPSGSDGADDVSNFGPGYRLCRSR